MRDLDLSPRWGRQIHYGPLAIPIIVGLAVGGAVVGISAATQSKASTINPNPAAASSQTVDPSSSSSINNLGRAALIMTSPQGVQGTDPVNKYALLGNQSGLGNK